MRKKTIQLVTIMTLTTGVMSGLVFADDQPRKSDGSARLKMTTEIAPGIASPDKVETRLGTLNFFDGVPDKASAEKIYDNLDFQHAVQAYLLGLPVVNQVANRDNILKVGPANATVPIWDNLVDSRTVELTANDNTPYSWFWLDLRKGPLVIEAPPKVLGLINDIWYHWNGDIGITGPDEGKGGKYLLLPPGYKGEVPAGYFVIKPGSFSVWGVWRSFVVDGDPKPGVDAVKKFTKIYPLSEVANPPVLKFVDMSGKPFNMVGPGDYRFWEILNQVVQDESTEAVDATTLALWAAVGIRKGQPFKPDERMKKILTEAAAVGDATGRALAYRTKERASSTIANGRCRLLVDTSSSGSRGCRTWMQLPCTSSPPPASPPRWIRRSLARVRHIRGRLSIPKGMPWMGARITNFICRQRFRLRLSGLSSFMTLRPARCFKRINSSLASAARTRKFR